MKSRCIVVLGVQGSGTSVVAGILHRLGVSMGRKIDSGSFEDPHIRRWVNRIEKTNDDDKQISEYLSERRMENQMWGIKEPRLCSKLDLIHRQLGDYRVICTERSPVACARSAAIRLERDTDKIQEMQTTLRECRNFLLEYIKPQALWVNFNNLTDRPEFYVRRIANFSFQGKEPPSEEQIQSAICFIDPSMNHKRELDT